MVGGGGGGHNNMISMNTLVILNTNTIYVISSFNLTGFKSSYPLLVLFHLHSSFTWYLLPLLPNVKH